MAEVQIWEAGVPCSICYDDIAPGSTGVGCYFCSLASLQYSTFVHPACWERWEPGTCLLCRRKLCQESAANIPFLVQWRAALIGVPDYLLLTCLYALLFTGERAFVSFEIAEGDHFRRCGLFALMTVGGIACFPILVFAFLTALNMHPCVGVAALALWCTLLDVLCEKEKPYMVSLLLVLTISQAVVYTVRERAAASAAFVYGILVFRSAVSGAPRFGATLALGTCFYWSGLAPEEWVPLKGSYKWGMAVAVTLLSGQFVLVSLTCFPWGS